MPEPKKKREPISKEKTKGRAYHKPQTAEPPEVTNIDKAKYLPGRSPAEVGPVALGRKHFYPEETHLRDKVLAHTPEGKRIFGYNTNGIPVCFARKAKGPGRCMQTATNMNGRCKLHGGRAKSGAEHWNAQHLRTADSLPRHMQEDMRRAALDPDLLSLDHEIHLLDMQEKAYKKDLDNGLTDSAGASMNAAIDKLESLIGTPKITDQFLEEIVEIWRKGRSTEATFVKIRKLAEDRRKLAETAHRRNKDLQQMMRYDQAMSLVKAIGSACRSGIETLMRGLEARYELVDKRTHQPVKTIDSSFANNFLTSIGLRLAKMISRDGSINMNASEGDVASEEVIEEISAATDLIQV